MKNNELEIIKYYLAPNSERDTTDIQFALDYVKNIYDKNYLKQFKKLKKTKIKKINKILYNIYV